MEELRTRTAFDRDAIGRQSVSEKRKGHMDPRVLDFYQQIKTSKGSIHTVDNLTSHF